MNNCRGPDFWLGGEIIPEEIESRPGGQRFWGGDFFEQDVGEPGGAGFHDQPEFGAMCLAGEGDRRDHVFVPQYPPGVVLPFDLHHMVSIDDIRGVSVR